MWSIFNDCATITPWFRWINYAKPGINNTMRHPSPSDKLSGLPPPTDVMRSVCLCEQDKSKSNSKKDVDRFRWNFLSGSLKQKRHEWLLGANRLPIQILYTNYFWSPVDGVGLHFLWSTSRRYMFLPSTSTVMDDSFWIKEEMMKSYGQSVYTG